MDGKTDERIVPLFGSCDSRGVSAAGKAFLR